jgi:hypothetical protein
VNNRGVVLFIEGETEIEFYKRLVPLLQKDQDTSRHIKVIYKNVKGLGNFKNKATNIFKNQILRNNPGTQYDVVLCYDTDVFEFSKKPPINWEEVEIAMKQIGANRVYHVKAKRSIEDWFLIDFEGVCRYLSLPVDTKISSGDGIDKIKNLFKRANRPYVKGSKIDRFIEQLDIDRIVKSVDKEIQPLRNLLGLKKRSK